MPRGVAAVIDVAEFQKAIDDLESSQTFATQGAVWEALPKTEWGIKAGVSAQYLMKFARENNITLKTPSAKSKGKKSKNADPDGLRKVIEELESTRTFPSRGDLWKAVLATEYGQEAGVSVSYLIKMAQEHNIVLKTQPAKRTGPPRDPDAQPARRAAKVTMDDGQFLEVDILIRVFNKHGIDVRGFETIMTSDYESPEENKRRVKAWKEFRETINCVKTYPRPATSQED